MNRANIKLKDDMISRKNNKVEIIDQMKNSNLPPKQGKSVLGASASAINFDNTLAPSHPSCLMKALCTTCNRKICHECFNNHNCTIKNDVEMNKAGEEEK